MEITREYWMRKLDAIIDRMQELSAHTGSMNSRIIAERRKLAVAYELTLAAAAEWEREQAQAVGA